MHDEGAAAAAATLPARDRISRGLESRLLGRRASDLAL